MTNLNATQMTELLRIVSMRIDEASAELGALDGAIGDADHGNTMARGFAAVVTACVEAANQDVKAGALLPIAGRSFLNAVGATTGPLYASAFLRAGQAFDAQQDIPVDRLPEMVVCFCDGIAQRGKATPGDKTMLDAWGPAARAVTEALQNGAGPVACLDAALEAASEGREATRAMVASVGRAARLGERSLGHVDPGAASAVIIIAALREGLTNLLQGEAS